jgi:hypothetical protein
MKKAILFFIWFPVSMMPLHAQNESPDPVFLNTYQQIIAYFPDIHVGGQYVELRRALEGHPYYGESKIENGTVVISGYEFSGIPLQYDIWDDMLITFSPIFMQKMIMNHLKLDRFRLHNGDVFVKKTKNPGYYYHNNGFYREIVKDEIGLYCKHTKERKQESSTIELRRYYNEIEKFFFEIDRELVPVPRKRLIFDMLGLPKKESKRLLKSKGYKFRKHKEDYLKTLVMMANEKTLHNE